MNSTPVPAPVEVPAPLELPIPFPGASADTLAASAATETPSTATPVMKTVETMQTPNPSPGKKMPGGGGTHWRSSNQGSPNKGPASKLNQNQHHGDNNHVGSNSPFEARKGYGGRSSPRKRSPGKKEPDKRSPERKNAVDVSGSRASRFGNNDWGFQTLDGGKKCRGQNNASGGLEFVGEGLGNDNAGVGAKGDEDGSFPCRYRTVTFSTPEQQAQYLAAKKALETQTAGLTANSELSIPNADFYIAAQEQIQAQIPVQTGLYGPQGLGNTAGGRRKSVCYVVDVRTLQEAVKDNPDAILDRIRQMKEQISDLKGELIKEQEVRKWTVAQYEVCSII